MAEHDDHDDIPPPPPGYHAAIGARGGKASSKAQMAQRAQALRPRHPQFEEMAIAYLTADPRVSYRAIATRYGAHTSTVMRAVKRAREQAAKIIVPGKEYIFTKSGNIVRAISSNAGMWTVERVDGQSRGKQMIVPAQSLAPVQACDEAAEEAAEL